MVKEKHGAAEVTAQRLTFLVPRGTGLEVREGPEPGILTMGMCYIDHFQKKTHRSSS